MNGYRLDGQHAVVTGGAQGLGEAISRLLCSRGAVVGVVDVDAEGAERTASTLREEGFDARAFAADVTSGPAVDALRAEVLDAFPSLEVLVNNVGAFPHRSIREISDDDWNHMFDVNLKSTFLVTRAFMDDMAAAGYGRIVNIASNDAYVPKVTLIHYAAAKAGVVSLTKTFAAELAPKGVIVSGVSPGAIATERAKTQSWLAERVKQIPLGRAAEPGDIAAVVGFLASPENRFVVGETVVANGGLGMY